MLKPIVSVVLVNFKQTEKTLCCLEKLDEMSVKPDLVVVVDNNSTEETRTTLQTIKLGVPVHFIFNKEI